MNIVWPGWLTATRWHRDRQILDDDEDFLVVTWDSCRFDAFLRTRTPVMDSLGTIRRAWAMATFTLPAHIALFQGMLPHVTESLPLYNRFCGQLWRIMERNRDSKPLVAFPHGTRSLAAGLRSRGYFTVGTGAMRWFRNSETLRAGFQSFRYHGINARQQNDFLIAELERRAKHRPCFAFVNYGETHSPFRHEGMPEGDCEVDRRFDLRHLFNQGGVGRSDWKFDEASFLRQVACAEFLDQRTGELLTFFRKRGRPTTVVFCADHGECFGENGLWGHALYHEKVMEVPMLIARLNAIPHAGLVETEQKRCAA